MQLLLSTNAMFTVLLIMNCMEWTESFGGDAFMSKTTVSIALSRQLLSGINI